MYKAFETVYVLKTPEGGEGYAQRPENMSKKGWLIWEDLIYR